MQSTLRRTLLARLIALGLDPAAVQKVRHHPFPFPDGLTTCPMPHAAATVMANICIELTHTPPGGDRFSPKPLPTWTTSTVRRASCAPLLSSRMWTGCGGVTVRLPVSSILIFLATVRRSGRHANGDAIAVSFACSSAGFVLSLSLREKRLGRAS
jgi:hypothetical protein